MKRTLTLSCALTLMLHVLLFLPSPPTVKADPINVSGSFQYRQNFGPNTIGEAEGERIKVGAVSVTPNGAQGTTGTATQGAITGPLTFSTSGAISGGFVPAMPDRCHRGSTIASLTGPSWLLSFANGPDTNAVFTPDLAGASSVPLVQDLAMSGISLTPTFVWTIPNGFAPDVLAVSIMDRSTLAPVYATALANNATSFTVPAVFPGGGSLTPGHAYSFEVAMIVTRGHVAMPTWYEPSVSSISHTYLDFSAPLSAGPVSAVYDDFNTGTTIDTSRWTSTFTPGLFSQHDDRLYFSSSTYPSGQTLTSIPISGNFRARVSFYDFASSSTFPQGYVGKASAAVFGIGPASDRAIIVRGYKSGQHFLATHRMDDTGAILEWGPQVNISPTQGMLGLEYANGAVTFVYNLGLDPNTGWSYLGTLHPNWDLSYVPSISITGGNSGEGTTSFQFDDVAYGPVPPLYAEFSSDGLYTVTGTTFTLLTRDHPSTMLTSGSSLYAYFASYGLYQYNGSTWTLLTRDQPSTMLASSTTLYADFPGYGLYSWDGSTWTKMTGVHPENMIVSASTLYAYFTGDGLYSWNGSTWTLLTRIHQQSMAASGSTLYAFFTGDGLYQWNGSTWTLLTRDQPTTMLASGPVLYADFPGWGVYVWNGTTWSRLTSSHPTTMLASGPTLYADFAGDGLYAWNGSAWTKLTGSHPANMLASSSLLYADFAGDGLYTWNGITWTRLTGSHPATMLVDPGN
jgi:hypothetical protein